MKKWLNRIINFILTGMLIATMYFAINAKISGGDPEVMGYKLLTVLSGSMSPTFQTGSVILIQPGGELTRFHKGDIITFHSPDSPDMLISHRIQEVQKSGTDIQYITKGDNNDASDSTPVPAVNVVGEYANFSIPYLGFVFSFVKSKLGIILLMIVPGILIILWQILSLFLWAIKSNKEKEEIISSKIQKQV